MTALAAGFEGRVSPLRLYAPADAP